MKKLVHLSKPGVCILVPEICSHGKHDVIRSSNVGLQIPRNMSHICNRKFYPKKKRSTNLPDPKLQLQRHSLGLEHCNQTGRDHPSRIKSQTYHMNRIDTTEMLINRQGKYLDNGGIISDFIVEATRWRFVVLRESTGKNLYQVRSILAKENEKPVKMDSISYHMQIFCFVFYL